MSKGVSVLAQQALGYVVFVPVLLLLLTMQVSAQKNPPILGTGDRDPSAFNKKAIDDIIEGYEKNVIKPDSASQELARQYRNRLISIGIEQTNTYFLKFIKSERRGRQWLQFLLDFLEIGAATAISITNGERAKTVMSEGLSALQASRTSLNRNFKFLERQIIVNQMFADRGEILVQILRKLEQGTVNYSWEAGRSDLQSYFMAGTIDGALAKLSATTGNAADESEAKIRRFNASKIIGPPTPDQRKASEDAESNKDKIDEAIVSGDPKQVAAALASLKAVVKKLEEDAEIRGQMIATGISSPTPDDAKKIFEGLITIATELTQNNRRDLVKKIDEAFVLFGN